MKQKQSVERATGPLKVSVEILVEILEVRSPSDYEEAIRSVINLGTAKALDLTIPDKLLAVADTVIE